jgi:hypothetical protein
MARAPSPSTRRVSLPAHLRVKSEVQFSPSEAGESRGAAVRGESVLKVYTCRQFNFRPSRLPPYV